MKSTHNPVAGQGEGRASPRAERAGLQNGELKALVEQLPVAAIACGVDGKIVWHNRKASKLLGRSPGSEDRFCFGFSVRLPDGRELEPGECCMFRAVDECEEFHQQLVFEPIDQSTRIVAASARPVYGADGLLLGAVAVFVPTDRDIAEARSERFLAAAADASGNAVLTVSTGLDIRSWNRAAQELLGYQAIDVLGRGLSRLQPAGDRRRVVELCRRALAGERVRADVVFTCKDDSLLEVEMTMTAVLADDGTVLGGCAVCRDISGRKEIERIREATLRSYELLAETSPCLLFHAEGRGGGTFVNDTRWVELTGREPGSWKGEGWTAAIHPDDRRRALESWRRMLASVDPHWQEEFRLRHVDGSETWVLARATALRAESESIREFVGVLTPISDRKFAEEALRRTNGQLELRVEARTSELSAKVDELSSAEQRLLELELAMENSMTGISEVDTTGRFRAVRAGYASMLGYECEEMIGMSWQPTVAESDLHSAHAAYERMVAEGRAEAELEGVRKDGSRFFKQILLVRRDGADGRLEGHYCFMRDISQRRAAEAELRLRDRAIEATGSGLLITRPIGTSNVIVDCNPALLRITGYSRDEVIGRDPLFLQAADRDQSELGEVRTALREQRECRVTLRNYRKSGELFWNEMVLSPLKDSRGRLTHYVGVVNDVSELHNGIEALQRELARTDQILTTAMDGYFLADVDGVIREVNPAYCEMVGFREDELIGRNLREFEEADVDAGLPARVSILRRDGRAFFEMRHRRKDGRVIDLELSMSTLDSDGKLLLVAFARSVSERKAAEEALHLTQFSVDRASDAIAWIEEDQSFSYVNDIACRWLGYTREEIMNFKVGDIDPGFASSQWPRVWNQAQAGKSAMFESSFLCKDGSRLPVEVSLNFIDYAGSRRVVAQARDITARKQVEEGLTRRSAFERLLLDLSAEFLSSDPDGFEHAIERALEAACRFVRADRVYVCSFSDDGSRMTSTHEWCGEGVASVIEDFQDRPVKDFGWLNDRLLKGHTIAIDNAGQLPAAANVDCQNLERFQVHSLLAVPLQYGEEVVGFVGFDAVKQPRDWEGELHSLLKLFADFFVSARLRLEAERSLRASEEKWRSLVSNAPSSIVMIDRDGNILFVNRIDHPYTREEIIGANVSEFIDPSQRPFIRELLGRVFEQRESPQYEIQDVGGIWHSCHLAPIIDDGEVTAAICIATDISGQMAAKQALQEKTSLLDEAQRLANMGNWEWDQGSNDVRWSNQLCRMCGLDPDAARPSFELFTSLIHPEDLAAARAGIDAILANGGNFQSEERITRADNGEERVIASFGYAVSDEHGRITKLRGACLDITESRKSERRLRDSLSEKETLLREIHHRVKNNLQIVSSLLHFQAKKLSDPGAKRIISEGQERLRAMVLVHEQLYRSEQLSQIDFGDYLVRLADEMRQSRDGGGGATVELQVDADPVHLPIETALPLGMIVNELVTNAFKHAFPDGVDGRIAIRLDRAPGSVRVRVSDDGCGIPGEAIGSKPRTFGLKLIGKLAAQVGANVEFSVDSGTEATFELPLAGSGRASRAARQGAEGGD